MEDLKGMLKTFWACHNAPLLKSCVMWFSLQQKLLYHNNSGPSVPDIIPKWSLCSLSISLPWKSFFLVTAHSSSPPLSRRGRSLYSTLFERWLWPVPAFFCYSFLLLSVLKKRLVDPSYFTVLVLISGLQKGAFYKGCHCYIYPN